MESVIREFQMALVANRWALRSNEIREGASFQGLTITCEAPLLNQRSIRRLPGFSHPLTLVDLLELALRPSADRAVQFHLPRF